MRASILDVKKAVTLQDYGLLLFMVPKAGNDNIEKLGLV